MAETDPEPSEEAESASACWHWVIVLAASALVVGWGLLIYGLVKDRDRAWDFGALPDTPAESIYSTQPVPQPEAPPRQIAPLPEAKPWQRPGADAEKPAAGGKPGGEPSSAGPRKQEGGP